MSGASIPYHLRPHKAVDRRLFLDLLARIERWRPLSDYVYLSMGAYPLEDHKLVHRLIGITRLIAFDLEKDIVARQIFNRPIESCHCIQKHSRDVVSELSNILRECDLDEESGIIVWLDYTNPKQIGQQIREFMALLDKMRIGDIVRITVNAHPNELLDPASPDTKPILLEERRERQLQSLKNRIADFLPSDVSANEMTSEGLAQVISKSFAAAALQALPVSGSKMFCPLSIVRYADGQQMLSITGAVMPRGEDEAIVSQIGLGSWPFASITWTNIHHLVVPALTIRERLFLERGVTTTPAQELIDQLGFRAASEVRIEDFLESYKKYYRFYPTLLTADV
jgi:hypothetical protein